VGVLQCSSPECKCTTIRLVLTCSPELSADLAGQKICHSCYSRLRLRALKGPNVPSEAEKRCCNPSCTTEVIHREVICKPEWDVDLAGQPICANCAKRFRRHTRALTDKDPNGVPIQTALKRLGDWLLANLS
jgi:hypothetical protein